MCCSSKAAQHKVERTSKQQLPFTMQLQMNARLQKQAVFPAEAADAIAALQREVPEVIARAIQWFRQMVGRSED